MKTGATKPEWDTPADGDFARYVERLTAPAPTPVQGGHAARSSAAAPPPSAVDALRAPAAPVAATGLPDLAQALQPVAGVLRAVRAVVLLLVLGHAVALFFFRHGSLPGLVVMGIAWWGLGWLAESLPGVAARVAQSAAAPRRAAQTGPTQRQTRPQNNPQGKKKRSEH
ncbi:MAG: hypothetical protein LWW96_13405 [Acidovorax sp.]|uniref:hypothetical protein n=1 Tax=Acidovorax sp. TaxID=1872122 RepID=UPI0025BAF267|nr:hypothetical protein [Acidovorax sp.]MCE1193138.1 hypothetical protein [Acidovorax sp.]